MKNLVKAVLKVMEECEGIEKSMDVGTGRSSYKGVSDKDVKIKVGQSMRRNGLIILPTKITPNLQIERWEEEQAWNGQKQMKQKQSAFTETITEYLLCHESGEHVTLSGYGHGVDTQDKGAGKATTYALKYTLLYTFLVATGHIDDADKSHSNDIEIPSAKPQTVKSKASKEDLFVKFAAKEGGLTKKVAGMIKKAINEYDWSNEKILKLLAEANNTTVTEQDIQNIK